MPCILFKECLIWLRHLGVSFRRSLRKWASLGEVRSSSSRIAMASSKWSSALKGYAWFWFSKRSGPAPFKSFQQNHHAQRVADPQHRDDTRRHANDDRVEHILEIASRVLEEWIPE